MIQATSLDSKDKIVAAFSKLLADYQQRESKVATKEEEVEKEKNQELLAKAADYTVDNIVNSMASLQLDFGNIINELKETLTTESDKLGELNKAIAVEQEQVQQLRQVRLVADALHILRQEHQEKIRQLEEKKLSSVVNFIQDFNHCRADKNYDDLYIYDGIKWEDYQQLLQDIRINLIEV